MSLAPCPVLSFLPRPCLVHLAYVSQKAAHLSDPVWPWIWIEPPRQYNRSFTLVWTQQLDTQNLWKLLGKYLPIRLPAMPGDKFRPLGFRTTEGSHSWYLAGNTEAGPDLDLLVLSLAKFSQK